MKIDISQIGNIESFYGGMSEDYDSFLPYLSEKQKCTFCENEATHEVISKDTLGRNISEFVCDLCMDEDYKEMIVRNNFKVKIIS